MWLDIIVAAFMSFLFRKDAWFIKLCGRIKNGILTFFRTFNFVTLSLVCSVLITCLAAAYIADLYGLGDTGDRYIFACLPAAMVVFVLAFWRICTLIFRNRQVVISIVLALVLAASTISSGRITCTYFMECPTTMKLEDISIDRKRLMDRKGKVNNAFMKKVMTRIASQLGITLDSVCR